MAALSLHYITFRSKQIGLHLQSSARGKKMDGFYLSCVFCKNWHASLRNELCLNEVDAQKVSDFFFFFLLEIKAG